MKKIFKMFLYKIQTKVCRYIDKLVYKLDKSYTNIKFENEITTRRLIIDLRQHIIKTHTVINILEDHIKNINKAK